MTKEFESIRKSFEIFDDRLFSVENKVNFFEKEIDNFMQLGNRDRLVGEVVQSLSRGFWGEFRKDLKSELKSEIRSEMGLPSLSPQEHFANPHKKGLKNSKTEPNEFRRRSEISRHSNNP